MKTVKLTAMAALVLFALPLVSVFGAGGYVIAQPILGTTGAPALASPSLYSGVLSVLYADGAPVVLSSNHVTLNLCGSTNNCVTVSSTLKQTAPGTYTYTFTPPSLTGSITIYVQSGSLADDNGRIFPSVNTSIGTYASASSTSSSGQSSNPVPTQTPTAAPQSPESTQLTKQAVSTTEPKQQSPVSEVVLALTVLAVAAVGLVLYPSRLL